MRLETAVPASARSQPVRTPIAPDQRRVDAAVEAICQQGCRSVNRVILRLEHGEPLAWVEGLNTAEQAAVLDELKAIMAVYTCGTED